MYENENYLGTNTENNQYRTYQTGTTGFQEPEKKKKKEKGGFLKKMLLSVSLGLFFGLFAGIGFCAVWQGMGMMQQSQDEEVETKVEEALADSVVFDETGDVAVANTSTINMVETDITDMVEEVMPAMVSIVNNYTETLNFWGQTYTQETPSSGSGIILAMNDTELLIASNYHVIEDATRLEVTFIDGSTAEAKIKGTDSDMDLAVIAISMETLSEETKEAISVATLGDSDELRLGEPVVAIGNALGYGQSVTNGIVSALNREIELGDGSKGTFIQTNAEINPGNSGGALLNIKGEVIGINSNKIGGDAIEGMGYAIPITSANPIIADLMERQTRDKVADGESGYIGITLQEVTQQISQMYNMPVGIYVYSTEEGSAAEKAGLLPGDIIVKFDGEKITSYEDLQDILQYYAAGTTAKITIMRPEQGAYVEYEFDITLGSRPKDR